MADYARVDSLRFQWFWRQKKRRQRQDVAVPPVLSSAELLADGVTIRCIFDQALTAGDAVGLTRSVGTITSASVVGGNLDIVVPKAYAGDSIGTLTYDGTGTLAGATVAVAAFGPVAIVNNSEQVEPVACAYPLDDDGSLSAAFGFLHAGPAVGADQQTMDYTAAATGGALLAPAGALGAARWSRPGSGKIAWEAINDTGTTAFSVSLLCLVTDAAGNLLEAGSVVSFAVGDVLEFTLDSAGEIVGLKNSVPVDITWLASAPTVGATDKVAAALFTTCDNIGEVARITLRANASDMTGSYGAGVTDPCGNAL